MSLGAGDVPPGPLRLVPGLRTRCDATGHVLVETPLGGVVDAGPHGHLILGLFHRPRFLSDALSELADGLVLRLDRMPTAATMAKLVAAGAITPAHSSAPTFGWSDPAEHARMISDGRRTDAYLKAIRAVVRPEDIVLDIGTGSGILAVAAAQAGARRVYAVEATDIAAVARQVIELNGVADRVTLVEGWSTQIELPERATLLVTETLGVEPFDEDILGAVLDARERLLLPGARIVPASLRLYAQALTVPEVQRWASRVDVADVTAWRERYGIDLSPLRVARRRTTLHWPVDCRTEAGWAAASPMVELVSVDFERLASASVQAATDLAIDAPATIDAILVTFSLDLHDGIRLVHRPRSDGSPSWDASVWFLPDALDVGAGSVVRIEYRYGVPGHADGLACHVAGRAP